LQQHAPGPSQARHEEPLSAEQHLAHAAHVADVVVDAVGERGEPKAL
jgi:hypothetical protein